MLGLSPLGIVHTVISIIAVLSGLISFVRYKKISWNNQLGKIYVLTTILTCLTAFGIFRHGGFGKGHALAIIELVVLAIAFLASEKTKAFGRLSVYIETIAYSFSFFLHLIPGITETTTRLPQGSPLASGPDDPVVKTSIGICAVLLVIWIAIQIQLLRKARQQA